MEMNVVTVLVAIISGVGGSYLTYYFAIRRKKIESTLKFREEKYSSLLILLQGFTGQTTSLQTARGFMEQLYGSWLYSSDGVVQAVNEMLSLVQPVAVDPEQWKAAVGNIVLEMRRDLLGKTRLTSEDFRYKDITENR